MYELSLTLGNLYSTVIYRHKQEKTLIDTKLVVYQFI
jgi:hypothetical protein